MITYAKRENFFEKTERAWRVEDDALVTRDEQGREKRHPWAGVVSVRLRFAPTRFKTWRYVFDVVFARDTVSIDNVHFAGIADFEDRSRTFTPFVHAALARIKALAPEAKAYAGATPVSYYAQAAFVIAAFALLALVLLTLPVLDAIPGVVIVKLVIVAAMIPVLIKWLRAARPRPMTLDAIPDDALPKVRS